MQDYKGQYHQYPIHSAETGIEGAFKRFTSFPTPKDVYDFALMGLPKIFPLTKEPIPVSLAETALNSAIPDIEMGMGCNLSPVTHYHSEDYIDGMFTNNFMGVKLLRWPATEIIDMTLKFPHTNTQSTYQKYTLPAPWIYLKSNKVNVVASMGNVAVSVDNSALVTAGGIFAYISAFGRGSYQPGVVEVVYKAGFEQDKMPSNVADLIKTWAAHRLLLDLIPVMFPTSGVNVSIDGVAQSVTYSIQQMLLQRAEALRAKREELAANFKKQFSKTIKTTFIGS